MDTYEDTRFGNSISYNSTTNFNSACNIYAISNTNDKYTDIV